jgi:hypothetical protein
MIRVTVHRKFADGSPSLSVSPRRGFKTFVNAANAAMRLLVDEARQPGHERIAEYVVTYRWDTGGVQRDFYRATREGASEYLRSEAVEEEAGRAIGPTDRRCARTVSGVTHEGGPSRASFAEPCTLDAASVNRALRARGFRHTSLSFRRNAAL